MLSLALLDETILAGTDDGIFTRGPEATAWTRLPTLIDGREVHPRVTELLALPPGGLIAATSQGVIRSSDEGWSWSQPEFAKREQVFGLAVFPSDSELVVAATESGFFRSRDGGETWRLVSSKLPGVTPHALVAMPSEDHVLLSPTTAGLFRSNDEGVTWRRMSGGIPQSDLTGIAVHPDGRTVYASDFDWGGIFRTLDGGKTWERLPTGDLPSDRVWTLGLDPASPERVLVSTASGMHLLVPTLAPGGGGVAPQTVAR